MFCYLVRGSYPPVCPRVWDTLVASIVYLHVRAPSVFTVYLTQALIKQVVVFPFLTRVAACFFYVIIML